VDLHSPLHSAEFLAVDTETNGLGGAACELTEVGAVLVGGGELHERWETLVQVERPLSRRIQAFTGISQEMVDGAPPAEASLPDLAALLEGRVLVAHSASFDRRVLEQAFDRAGLRWPDPPVLCTVALARRLHPLARQRRLALLAASLGIEVETTHRALADAETCARVFCALFPKLAANAATVGDALALVRPARPARRRAGATDGGGSRRGVRRRLPDLSGLADSPGVYVARNDAGQVLYVGKSMQVRRRVRAHFAPSSPSGGWTERAETVEHHRTLSELGALVLEQRLVDELRPPGNARLKAADELWWLRCRLDIAFPVLEIGREPAAGHAVNAGPLRGRAVAVELAEQLSSLFGLRACGRRLQRRDHPSAYGQMGRCLSPCLGDLDPNLYRRRLDEVLALLRRRDPRRAVLAHVDAMVAEAAADQRFERAAWLRRRRERLRVLLRRAGPGLAVTPSRPIFVLADAPDGDAWEAFWLVGGRVADWGPLPEPAQVVERSAAALRHAAAPLLPAETAQARIAASWVAANEPHRLDLSPAPTVARVERFLRAAGAAPCASDARAARDQGVAAPAPKSFEPSATCSEGGASTLTLVP
jgi:DNA polymerase-3 subunit epsilon